MSRKSWTRFLNRGRSDFKVCVCLIIVILILICSMFVIIFEVCFVGEVQKLVLSSKLSKIIVSCVVEFNSIFRGYFFLLSLTFKYSYGLK